MSKIFAFGSIFEINRIGRSVSDACKFFQIFEFSSVFSIFLLTPTSSHFSNLWYDQINIGPTKLVLSAMLGTMRHIFKIEKTDLDTRLSQLSDRFSRTKISRKFSKFYWTVALIVSYSHLERKKNVHSLWSENSNFSSEPRLRSCIFPNYSI